MLFRSELLVNFELFLCGNWAMIYLFLCGNWAMIYLCLVETKCGGVINLLPDYLSEIGVEYVKVSYSLHCSYWIIHLFFFFFPFSLHCVKICFYAWSYSFMIPTMGWPTCRKIRLPWEKLYWNMHKTYTFIYL